MKIGEITPNSREIEATIQVVEKLDARDVTTKDGSAHKVAEFLAGDDTACIVLSLWDEAIESVEIGKSYKVENAYITVFRNSMRISLGRMGKIGPSDTEVAANKTVNLSDRHVENPRDFGGGSHRGSGGFRGGGRRF